MCGWNGVKAHTLTHTHTCTQGEASLTRSEEKLLASINRAYYLPRWCSVGDDTYTHTHAQTTYAYIHVSTHTSTHTHTQLGE